MSLDSTFYAPAIGTLADAKAMALEQLDRITTVHEEDGTDPDSKFWSPIINKRRLELITAINACASIDAVLNLDLNASWPARSVAGGLSVGHPYIVAFDCPGVPEASEILIHHVFTYAGAFPASLTGSYVKADTAATSSTAIDIKLNGTSKGTITFAAAGTTATFTFSAAVYWEVGDVLTLVAPGTADATLAGIYGSLLGAR